MEQPVEAAITPLAPSISSRNWSEPLAFVVMVTVLAVAPLYIYPMFLMQALCFALFACAFNL